MCANVFKDAYSDPTLNYHEGVAGNPSAHLDLSIMDGKPKRSFPSSGETLAPGDHFFQGSTNVYCPRLGCTAYTLNTSGTGTVRIFVDGDLTFTEAAEINANRSAQNLVLVVKGNLYATTNSTFNGLIYVTGDVIFKEAGFLQLRTYSYNGALTAHGTLRSVDSGSFLDLLFGGLLSWTRVTTDFQSSVVDAANLTGLCDKGYAIDHFQLSWSGPALTCAAKEITVKACANADCSSTFDSHTAPMTATFLPTGQTLTFPARIGTTTYYLRQTTAKTLTLGATPHSPIITDRPVRCKIGVGASGTNCSLTFSDSGLVFDVPDMTANKPVQTVLRAVKKDLHTESCVPAFANASKDVSFWASYVSPGNGSRKVLINGAEVGAGVAASRRLSFNANGEAALEVRYSDAGEMQLDARFTGTGEEAGLIMEGNDGFKSVPAGFCVQTDKVCTTATPSCTATYVAGKNFQLRVKPVAWQSDTDQDFCVGNLGTPNFALESIGLGLVKLAPTGGFNGSLSQQSYNHQITSATNDGLNTINLHQSEVGVFKVQVTPPQYLGKVLPAAESMPLGRFIPDHLKMAVEDKGSLASSCNGFTYLGEPFGYSLGDKPRLRITALNAQGQVTKNYSDATGFRKLKNTDMAWIDPTVANNLGADGAKLPLTVSINAGTLTDVADQPGEMLYTFNGTDSFKFNKRDGASILTASQVVPFLADIPLTLSAKDGDNVSTSTPTTFTPNGNWLRYGRLVMGDAFGSAETTLPIPMRMEYLDATGFVRNEADSCTSYEAAKFNLIESDVDGDGFDLAELLAGIVNPVPGHTSELILLAPNRNGAALLEYDAPEWLEHSWPHGRNPRATATFGVYRGVDRMIYWREP